MAIQKIHCGILSMLLLDKASLKTFESCADPFHPLSTYMNSKSKLQAANTFCEIVP